MIEDEGGQIKLGEIFFPALKRRLQRFEQHLAPTPLATIYSSTCSSHAREHAFFSTKPDVMTDELKHYAAKCKHGYVVRTFLTGFSLVNERT